MSSIKKYIKDNPKLFAEFDIEKNTEIDVDTLTLGSGRKVWWKCKLGHSWQAVVCNRSKGQGCPYCSGKRVIPGVNSLFSLHPELIEEWDYEKNDLLGIYPDQIRPGSNKKVWWKCKLGHSWQIAVVNRVSGANCPFCSNVKLLKGYNDLATTNPALALEWNYDKNELTPADVFEKSRQSVWWRCKRGHEWKAPLYSRAIGVGCPICDKENKTSFPEQAILFYISKLFEVKNRTKYKGKEVDILLPDYSIGIEYNGKYYHEKRGQKDIEKEAFLISNGIVLFVVKENEERTAFDGDHTFYYKYNNLDFTELEKTIRCLIKTISIKTGVTKTVDVNIERDRYAIQEQFLSTIKSNSIIAKDPNLIDYWDKKRNGNIDMEYVQYGTETAYWWTCRICGNSWKRIPNKMIGRSCPFCDGTMIKEGFNDFATLYPDLLKEWDYTRNTVDPNKCAPKSNKKYNWICSKGHSYESSIYHRTIGRGCPICSNKRILPGVNDLATTNPELAEEWNYDKNNGILPSTVSYGSKKRVWWKCKNCGYEWQASIDNRSRGNGCPQCARQNYKRNKK